jgi:putative sigma-54 modulation protein
VQEVVARKAEKLLTYFERVTAINIAFDVNAELVKCEILVDAEHKHNFVAHDESTEALAAFEQALSKMEQQIKRYKEKVQDHRRDKPLGQLAADAEPSD